MVQSVELLLDEASDAQVRQQWDRLIDLGLPSQGRHPGASNAPHVTLAARARIDTTREPALRNEVACLPVPLRLGALACFGRGRFVLVRLVVADTVLLRLHARVAGALGPDPDDPEGTGNLAPGRWTPHVTLAHRLSAEQVGGALAALEAWTEVDGAAVGCRRWDSVAREVWSLR